MRRPGKFLLETFLVVRRAILFTGLVVSATWLAEDE